MKFLLVEDNAELAKAISSRMKFDGHVVDHAAKLSDAIAFSETGEYDLILLDIMLPDGDGRSFLKWHRSGGQDTPVIVLTARSQVSDRISMLDLGADDYVTKPFGIQELLARVQSALRRSKVRDGTFEAYRFGPFSLDFETRKLFRDNAPVEITEREFTLLSYLIKNSERALSMERTLRDVWGYGYDGTARTIDNFITRLRRKLEDDPRRPTLIQTVRGHGYRFSPDNI